jgi:glycosyltransferase involved in cell wall biosynthesis
MDEGEMKTLIIIPAYNEEESLPRLLEEVRRAGYDAVVVDDASSDATESLAKAAGFPVLSLAVNLGIGGGVQTGFVYALRNGYDIVVQVDGDGQHDPGQIFKVIEPLVAGKADCVIGSRYMPEFPDTGYKTPLARRAGMYFSTGILYLATGMLVHDTTSGFRALNRPAFGFFATQYPVDHPEAESLLLLHQAGFRVQEVPVRMRCRSGGQSLFNFFEAILYPLRVIIGFMGILYRKSRRNKI